jgi:hypothetical protein
MMRKEVKSKQVLFCSDRQHPCDVADEVNLCSLPVATVAEMKLYKQLEADFYNQKDDHRLNVSAFETFMVDGFHDAADGVSTFPKLHAHIRLHRKVRERATRREASVVQYAEELRELSKQLVDEGFAPNGVVKPQPNPTANDVFNAAATQSRVVAVAKRAKPIKSLHCKTCDAVHCNYTHSCAGGRKKDFVCACLHEVGIKNSKLKKMFPKYNISVCKLCQLNGCPHQVDCERRVHQAPNKNHCRFCATINDGAKEHPRSNVGSKRPRSPNRPTILSGFLQGYRWGNNSCAVDSLIEALFWALHHHPDGRRLLEFIPLDPTHSTDDDQDHSLLLEAVLRARHQGLSDNINEHLMVKKSFHLEVCKFFNYEYGQFVAFQSMLDGLAYFLPPDMRKLFPIKLSRQDGYDCIRCAPMGGEKYLPNLECVNRYLARLQNVPAILPILSTDMLCSDALQHDPPAREFLHYVMQGGISVHYQLSAIVYRTTDGTHFEVVVKPKASQQPYHYNGMGGGRLQPVSSWILPDAELHAFFYTIYE